MLFYLSGGWETGNLFGVCEITFETWADALSGHDKVCMDISGVVSTFVVNLLKLCV